MSLDTAMLLARQSLVTAQQQIALSGRNVAVAGDPTRSRVVGLQETLGDGSVRIAEVRRAEDTALYTRMIKAVAATAEREATLKHLENLAETVGDPQDGSSAAAHFGELKAALVSYANQPDDPLFGRQVVERARDLATALNRAANETNLVRQRADAAMNESVSQVNRLLSEFEDANNDVKRAVVNGADATAFKDRRDAIVQEIAEHLGVTTYVREGGDMVLFTDGGVTLFDRSPRAVEFERTVPFTAATVGGNVVVDGLVITGPSATMPSQKGAIVGHASVRDTLGPTYRLQLDEMAEALVATFQDAMGPLFDANPADYSGTIAVSSAVDPVQGGSVENLRDGTGNPMGYAAYSDRLMGLIDAVDSIMTFDPAAELGTAETIDGFMAGSVSWLEAQRASVTEGAEVERTVLESVSLSLSAATGVNMDDEYARQLEIERSYAASARLISIIEEMFDELMRSV